MKICSDGSVTQSEMRELIIAKGLYVLDRKSWNRVNGKSGKRSLNFQAANPFSEITTTGYRIQHPLCESISPQYAEEHHVGRVRGWIRFKDQDPVQVAAAIEMAVAALVDSAIGTDIL